MASDPPSPFSQVDDGAAVDRWVPSTCGVCSIGCGIEIAVAGTEIVGVRGRRGHAVSDGRLGPKGLNQYVANRARAVLTVEPRTGGEAAYVTALFDYKSARAFW